MTMRGRPRKPTWLHVVENTYRRDRHSGRPGSPKKPDSDDLTDAQRELLALIPAHLSREARAIYCQQATLGWWLKASDYLLLASFARACDEHSVASRELSRLMHDPGFANPASVQAKAGRTYSQIADRAANTVLTIAGALGFTPMSRQRLGIDVDSRPTKPKDADPWAALRLKPVPTDPVA